MIAALTIFSVGVLATIEVFTTCMQSTSASLGYTRAVHLAQKVVEETIAEGELSAGSASGDFGTAFQRHSWKREVEETDQNDLYSVHVVVTWDERGREKRFSLTTLVAQRQVQ